MTFLYLLIVMVAAIVYVGLNVLVVHFAMLLVRKVKRRR